MDEALCFGWIDGIRKSHGADAYTIRFTPRKPTSTWSAVNVDRVKELTAQGRMSPAGLAVAALRTPERTGTYSYERAAAKLAPEQDRLLRANAKASAFFAAQAPWYQRAAIHWVTSAKRDATKASRLAELIRDSAAGQLVKPLRRPARRSPRRSR